MKFFKTTNKDDTTTVTFYVPLEPCNVMRYSHVKSSLEEEVEGEKTIKEVEFIGIEYNVVAEQSYPVPLKVMKRIKQTKVEEVFVLEQVIKALQPMLQKVEEPEEVSTLLGYLNSNCI